MANWLGCGWDAALTADGVGLSLQLDSTAGGPYAVVISTGTFAHIDLTATAAGLDGAYDDFATALKTALDATADTSTYTVSFSTTTGLYTITRDAGGTFTLTFAATDTAIAMRRVLGLSATTASTAAVITSDVRPYYWIVPALPGVGRVSRAYHGDAVAFGGITGTGIPYGLAVDGPAKFEDITFMAEANTATLDDDLVAAVPFTWEGFFDHVANQHPYYYYSGTNPGRVYVLRSEDGAAFDESNRERLEADWDSAWHVTLRGVRMGTFTV